MPAAGVAAFSARCGLSTQAEDWEKAADVMQRHLKVVPEQDGGSSEEAAMQALRRSLAEMQTIILDKCQAAADAADYKVRVPTVPRHCLCGLMLRSSAAPLMLSVRVHPCHNCCERRTREHGQQRQ
jgi:hypothetical protein